ncbi:retrotransposon protein, putative, ty1-copia subclass [Tanacetum coccineum]
MHNMGKRIGEIHALLIEYEKGLPKKDATPQVMAIQGGRIQKANKKSLNAKGMGKRKGKMTKKPFPHSTERVTDLLGLIHTDVFKNEVENQLRKTIKALQSDHRGGEYISQEFKDYLKACGIDYALETATRILNMVPTKKVDKTPYELWYGKFHNLSYLRIWGYEALVKRDMPNKLQQRSVKCIFIGYPKKTMSYYSYFSLENKIVVARYAEFLEKNLISQEVEGFEPPQEEVVPVRKSARIHRALDRLCINVEVEEHSLGDLNEPTNYKAALLDP